MENLWLIISLASLVTGFGLIIALMLLKRMVPLPQPPAVIVLTAFLLMGMSSLGGVYLRIMGIPRSIYLYRILNAAAWGYAVFASLFYVYIDMRMPAGRIMKKTDGEKHVGRGLWRSIGAGIAVGVLSFTVSHPVPGASIQQRIPEFYISFIMLCVELFVSILVIRVGVKALKRSKNVLSKPWKMFLGGLGLALLVIIPANLLDYIITLIVKSRGGMMRDGFVFAFAYCTANIALLIALLRALSYGNLAASSVSVPECMIQYFGLTRREREIVEKLLEGKSDREIGEELYISPRTVDTHLQNIYRKCNVSSRVQLTGLVYSYGKLPV